MFQVFSTFRALKLVFSLMNLLPEPSLETYCTQVTDSPSRHFFFFVFPPSQALMANWQRVLPTPAGIRCQTSVTHTQKASPRLTSKPRRAPPRWGTYLTRGAFATGHHTPSSSGHSETGQCRTGGQAGDQLQKRDDFQFRHLRGRLSSPGSEAG